MLKKLKEINRVVKWILKKEKVKKWIYNSTHSTIEKPEMTYRIMIGIFLIIFSFAEYYGGMVVCSVLAVYFESPEIVVIGVPLLYGLSWIIWLLGMYLLGKVNYEYVKYRLAIYLKNKYQPGFVSTGN